MPIFSARSSPIYITADIFSQSWYMKEKISVGYMQNPPIRLRPKRGIVRSRESSPLSQIKLRTCSPYSKNFAKPMMISKIPHPTLALSLSIRPESINHTEATLDLKAPSICTTSIRSCIEPGIMDHLDSPALYTLKGGRGCRGQTERCRAHLVSSSLELSHKLVNPTNFQDEEQVLSFRYTYWTDYESTQLTSNVW